MNLYIHKICKRKISTITELMPRLLITQQINQSKSVVAPKERYSPLGKSIEQITVTHFKTEGKKNYNDAYLELFTSKQIMQSRIVEIADSPLTNASVHAHFDMCFF